MWYGHFRISLSAEGYTETHPVVEWNPENLQVLRPSFMISKWLQVVKHKIYIQLDHLGWKEGEKREGNQLARKTLYIYLESW